MICRCGEMVDAHASGACEETHGGSSPFIGKYFKKKESKGLITPVVSKKQRRFTHSGILIRTAHKFVLFLLLIIFGTPTTQVESLHRQIFQKNKFYVNMIFVQNIESF